MYVLFYVIFTVSEYSQLLFPPPLSLHYTIRRVRCGVDVVVVAAPSNPNHGAMRDHILMYTPLVG